MNHPGRIFITDAAAGKPWGQPVRIVWGRTRSDFKIVDARGAVVRRFKRWRYAYQAYAYLCLRIEQEALDESAARRELHRDSWERASREHALFKRRKAEVSEAGKARREEARQAREKRSTAFWKRMGGKPGLPTG